MTVTAAPRTTSGPSVVPVPDPSAAPTAGHAAPGLPGQRPRTPGRLLALVPAEAVSDPAQVAGWVLVDPGSASWPAPTTPTGALSVPAPTRATPGTDALPVHVDLDRRTVSVGGRGVDLTYTEFEILAALTRQAGAAVSRAELVRLVWPDGAPEGTAAKGLNVHVHRLRRKLGADLGGRIRTLRGYGYRYDAA